MFFETGRRWTQCLREVTQFSYPFKAPGTGLNYIIESQLDWYIGAAVQASPPETSCPHGVMGWLYSQLRCVFRVLPAIWPIPTHITFYLAGVEWSVVSWWDRVKCLFQCFILLIHLTSTCWVDSMPGTGTRSQCDRESKDHRIIIAHCGQVLLWGNWFPQSKGSCLWLHCLTMTEGELRLGVKLDVDPFHPLGRVLSEEGIINDELRQYGFMFMVLYCHPTILI